MLKVLQLATVTVGTLTLCMCISWSFLLMLVMKISVKWHNFEVEEEFLCSLGCIQRVRYYFFSKFLVGIRNFSALDIAEVLQLVRTIVCLINEKSTIKTHQLLLHFQVFIAFFSCK